MAMKALVFVLFVCFLGSASACLDDSDCYGVSQSCCSDFVCREACIFCSYDSQCGTGECCDSIGDCSTSCTYYISSGGIVGVVIGCLVIVAIIASIVACCCCACCPYYRYRQPGQVIVARPAGYQPFVSTTSTQQQTMQHPPPSGFHPPPSGFHPPPSGFHPPPTGAQPPPYSSYPQPQVGGYPPPQAQAPYPQATATGVPIKQ